MNKKLIALATVVIIAGAIFAIYISLLPKASGIERYMRIPEKPNDFSAYSREIWGGEFVELCDLDGGYWKQPEFYGDSWKNAQEKFYDNPDYVMWGVYGQGSIPREIGYSFKNLKKGDEFKLCTFFHNGFGVWTYQGFKLIPFGENEYFKIEITPNEFITAPTFPVFEDEWTKKIEIKIIVKETPPKGDYIFRFNTQPPSRDFSREATKQVLKLEVDKELYYQDCLKYLKDTNRCEYLVNMREKKYVDGGNYQTNVSPLTINVEVL